MTRKEKAIVENITKYVIVYYTFEERKFVPLEHVLQIKEWAKELLKKSK